jgi:hypothetical protein
MKPDLTLELFLTMLETSARPSPTTTPAKPGPERDDGINRYHENIFVRFYRLGKEGENDDGEPQLFEEVLDDTMVVDE